MVTHDAHPNAGLHSLGVSFYAMFSVLLTVVLFGDVVPTVEAVLEVLVHQGAGADKGRSRGGSCQASERDCLKTTAGFQAKPSPQEQPGNADY